MEGRFNAIGYNMILYGTPDSDDKSRIRPTEGSMCLALMDGLWDNCCENFVKQNQYIETALVF